MPTLRVYGSPGPGQAARLTTVDSLALEKGGPMDEVVLPYSRALDLLSRSSVYVPRDTRDEIVRLAKDGNRAGIPVRVERSGGMVIIDPWKAIGKETPHGVTTNVPPSQTAPSSFPTAPQYGK